MAIQFDLEIAKQHIKKSQIFSNVEDLLIVNLLNNGCCIKKFNRSSKIYNSGEQANHLYFILQGCVNIGMLSGPNKIIVKHMAYEMEIFGENLFTTTKRNEFAEAFSDVIVLMIPAYGIRKLLMSSGFFANAITSLMLERLRRLEERMQAFVFRSAKDRIVEFIKSNAIAKGTKIGIDEILINHGMSHKEISYLTDTSRQTVARILTELKNHNIIHFSTRKSGKILVRNIEALA
jgi:CRP/FNR family transcriptional regulator